MGQVQGREAETEEETTPQFFDSLEIVEDHAADEDMVEAEIRERELLEEMPLPGTNLDSEKGAVAKATEDSTRRNEEEARTVRTLF